MTGPDYFELFRALIPELALVLGALVVLAFDLIAARRDTPAERLNSSVIIGALSLVAALWHTVRAGVTGPAFDGVLMFDTLAFGVRLGVLVLSFLTLLLAAGTASRRHSAEFVAVILFATTGFMLMAVAQQLLLAFLALELASLSLYILAGFDKTRPESAEAGLKYFLFGGMAAAFLLFGFSLLYGLTGSLDFPEIAAQLARQGLSPLLLVALVMVLVAFGFKASAAPFHLWAPDVYEGAPPTAAALISSASKLAGLALFTRLLWPALGVVAGIHSGMGWIPVVVLLSAASLLLGNIAALAQTNVRRLLAYSAIAHAGALLLGLIAAGRVGVGPLFYYAATYGLATVGAFGVIAVVDQSGGCQKITDLAGLYRRSPLLTVCLMVFILSLAGVPPLAGFFGKFSVFAAALQFGGLHHAAGWLALLAIALSAVALYYYLVILKQALVAAPAPHAPPIRTPAPAAIALLLSAILILGLGVFPSVLLGLIKG